MILTLKLENDLYDFKVIVILLIDIVILNGLIWCHCYFFCFEFLGMLMC